MKIRTLLAAACLLTLPVAGCGTLAASSSQSGAPSTDSGAGPGLPDLSPAQDLRDQVARAEAAIAEAASNMVDLATECDDCRTWLERTGTDADARLQLSGGLWTPWPDASAESLAELPQPPAIGEAPLTPAGLVGFMHRTAMQQIEELSATADISAEETTTLASLLTGRLAAAHLLGENYGISAVDAASLLPPGASWTSVGVPVVMTANDAYEFAEVAAAQSDQESAWATDASAAAALLDYDCVGTTLGFTDLSSSGPATERGLYISLLERVDALVGKGVPDHRGVRCVLQESTADEAMNSLLATDMELLSAPDFAIRRSAADYLLQDLAAWMELGQPGTVSPALVSGDLGVSDD